MMRTLAVVAMLATAFPVTMRAEQCGWQAGGAPCPNCHCCSAYGWCVTDSAFFHCDPDAGCQSQCDGCGADGIVGSIIWRSPFEQMLLHRNDSACPARGFYTYDAFIAAANSFPGFGTTGSLDIQKREIAAFLAQTSHETSGGWPTAPDGPYSWGYCFKEQRNPGSDDYCYPSNQWFCTAGKKYYGRGPFQISATVSFKTALWFWMTPHWPAPSPHDVITEKWCCADTPAGRVSGYGVITNIINGRFECGHGVDSRVASRIGFYKRYCDILGVSYGRNLDCYSQKPFIR